MTWQVFKRGHRWYIETSDNTSIDQRLSDRLNNGGRGYQTKREAEEALSEFLRPEVMG